MIVRAAVVPSTPLLLPGLTGGFVPEAERLVAASAAAVAWAAAGARLLVGLGGSRRSDAWDPATSWSRGDDGFRGRRVAGDTLPLSLEVVRSLAGGASVDLAFYSVAFDAGDADVSNMARIIDDGSEAAALVVSGDGSGRRSVKAPGYLDPRASSFDSVAERALATGDASTLLAIDASLASELLASGRAAWQVLATIARGRVVSAALDHCGDPFGVWYGVARWEICPRG